MAQTGKDMSIRQMPPDLPLNFHSLDELFWNLICDWHGKSPSHDVCKVMSNQAAVSKIFAQCSRVIRQTTYTGQSAVQSEAD